MQEPPKLGLNGGALINHLLPVRRKQSDLPLRTREGRRGQVGVRKRRPRHRGRIDRIGLAADPIDSASLTHEPRRHPHRVLPATDQVPLQVPGDMPAVLDREQALVVKVPCPRHEPLEAGAAGAHREFLEHLAGRSVDRDSRVGLLMRVDPDYDHLRSPFWTPHPDGRDHRRTRLSGADARSYEVTPAGLGRRRAAEPVKVIPLAG